MHMCTTLYHIVPHCTTCVPHVYHIPITPKFHFRFTKFKISGLLWWWLKPGQMVIWYRWRIPVQHWQISETTKEIPWMLMKKQKITIMLSYFRMWFHLSFSFFQMCACGIVAQGLAVERRGFLIPGPWVHGCKSFGVGGGGGGGGGEFSSLSGRLLYNTSVDRLCSPLFGMGFSSCFMDCVSSCTYKQD
jgi:hypothetical protein